MNEYFISLPALQNYPSNSFFAYGIHEVIIAPIFSGADAKYIASLILSEIAQFPLIFYLLLYSSLENSSGFNL